MKDEFRMMNYKLSCLLWLKTPFLCLPCILWLKTEVQIENSI
jgi:hypothetical protein